MIVDEITLSPTSYDIQTNSYQPETTQTDLLTNVNYITLSFVGDCMLASMYGSEGFQTFNKLANEVPPEYFFANVAELFASDDLTIANCENIFTDNNELLPIIKDHDPAYWYKSKSANAEIFKKGNIDVVSLANNHIYDYGSEGRSDTITALENAGVIWGDSNRPLYFEIKGLKIALLCTTINTIGYVAPIIDWLNDAEADYKIIYYHGGIEMMHEPDPKHINAARALADNGADLVIGHHPHVLQPVENYNGATIIYSLGNFIFGGGRPENRSIIFQVTLCVVDGEILSKENKIIPVYCYAEDYQPAIIEDETHKQKVIDFMRGLTEKPI